jgi:hypothetical protein
MAEHVAPLFLDPFARATDAFDLVRLALTRGAEGAPAWPAAALERLRGAVREVLHRLARVRSLGYPADASPELQSLATHLGLPAADAPAPAVAVEEGCEAA